MNTKRLIALALSVSFLLGLSACNTDTGTETSLVSSVAETTRDVYAVADYDPENPITMETSPEYSDEALLGSWELVNGGVTETYTFATSNSGTYSITADSNSTDRGFTYNVVEGNTVEFLFDEAGYIERYTYTIEDQTLTLTDEWGGVLVLTKAE
ncbi:MAG: hypothetical protein IKN54_01570 [Lachnospiraceae bacterium]|nr:hypothetical protein [Lachnospiraceae bacterium]